MRTTIYLDVDGVLNPFRAKNPHKHWDDYKKHPTVEGFKVWRSQEMGAWIRDLDADIVWATTWNDHAAPSIGEPMGLPFYRHVPFRYDDPDVDDLMNRGNCGKLPTVSNDAGDKPIVWIDDMHGPDDRAWGEARPYPTLLITPSPSVGLTKQMLVEIEDFIWTNR